MKLMRITEQSQKGLRQFYDLSRWKLKHWQKPISAMLELVVYLEESVDFPPQWVFTSHENLIFARQDDSREGFLSIQPLQPRLGSKAKYQVNLWVEAPWSHVEGYAADVEQAWQLIVNSLTPSAVEGLPITGIGVIAASTTSSLTMRCTGRHRYLVLFWVGRLCERCRR